MNPIDGLPRLGPGKAGHKLYALKSEDMIQTSCVVLVMYESNTAPGLQLPLHSKYSKRMVS